MAEDSKIGIKFHLKDIDIVEEDYSNIYDAMKGRNSEDVRFTIDANIDPREAQDEVIVNVIVLFSLKDEGPIGKLSIRNIYSVDNLQDITGINEERKFIRNDAFVLFLVDASIGHLRAIQAVRMKSYRKIPKLPLFSAQQELS